MGKNKSAALAGKVFSQDTDASKVQFENGRKMMVDLVNRPQNNVVIVIVSDGVNVSAGCIGSHMDIITTLNPGVEAVAQTVKAGIAAVQNQG